MVDWIVYLVATFAAGGIAAFVIAMFKVGPGKPEFRFGRLILACLGVTTLGPFAYVEGLTKWKGKEISPVVHAWYHDDNSINGKLVKMKILYLAGNRATVLVIGDEPEDWGGSDRPVVKLALVHSTKGWEVDSVNVLRSSRLDKDEFVFPPYG